MSTPAPERTDEDAPRVFQQGQPEGVPPLELTGERTLPDVPDENYWYQRHLVVYEWISDRVTGLRVTDLACGEGYGSAVLARTAESVVGVDANPEAFEHAKARYGGGRIRFERTLIETFDEPCDAVVFLQTIEHVEDAGAILDRCRALVSESPRAAVYVSTPNVLTLAPEGAERSGNPWHVHEYRAGEFRELCEAYFPHVEMYGLHHAGKLAVHQKAIEKLAWDSVHSKLGITGPFYRWFVPAISVRDFSIVSGSERPLDEALDFIAVLRP